jgi:hypothetical protein
MKRTPAEEAQCPGNAPQAFSSFSSTPESRQAAASQRAPASIATDSGKSSATARRTHVALSLPVGCPASTSWTALMRRQDQRTPQRGRLLPPRADHQFQGSSDFGAELAAQRHGGLRGLLAPAKCAFVLRLAVSRNMIRRHHRRRTAAAVAARVAAATAGHPLAASRRQSGASLNAAALWLRPWNLRALPTRARVAAHDARDY